MSFRKVWRQRREMPWPYLVLPACLARAVPGRSSHNPTLQCLRKSTPPNAGGKKRKRSKKSKLKIQITTTKQWTRVMEWFPWALGRPEKKRRTCKWKKKSYVCCKMDTTTEK